MRYSRYSRRWAQTVVQALCLWALASAFGCGRGDLSTPARQTISNQIIVSPDSRAMAHVSIHWPTRSTREIPVGTNRIVVFINASDIKGALAYISDKPAVGGVSNFTVDIPAGPGRRFSVDARKVDPGHLKYTDPNKAQSVAFASSDLFDGQSLGGGHDSLPTDIAINGSVNVDITLAPAATGSAGTTSVTVTINQVLPGAFPTVLVLQLIRDQNGNPISDLTAANFKVTEDDTLALITDVRTVQQAAQTLSASIVLDRSASMAEVTDPGSSVTKNAAAEAAASKFVSNLQSTDLAEIINFSESASVDQTFTSNQALLNAAIQGKTPNGNTALFDAIYQGVQDTSAQGGRAAVIALTDGISNRGSRSLVDVQQVAKQNGIPVFTVGLGSNADKTTLQSIATQTGGLFTFSPSTSDLQTIYNRIAAQLNGQIQLSFISPDLVSVNKPRHVVVKFHYGPLVATSEYDYTM